MIAITGIGCVTGFGAGVQALERGLKEGRSALTDMYQDTYPCARVQDVDDERSDRCAMFLELAINEALDHAGHSVGDDPLPLIVGSTHGELRAWETEFDPSATYHVVGPKMPKVSSAALQGRAKQVPFSMTTACTASAHALAYARAQIRSGAAERVVIAGGDVISDFLLQGFIALRAVSRVGCTPFAAKRDGISLGEGAAALVVESEETAKARGAEIVARISGIGFGSDAFNLTAPEPSGQSMSKAIEMSVHGHGDAPEFVNVHGTGSELNDSMEYHALARVFGDRLRDIQVSATKNATGHTCGGATALELIICSLALQGRVVPGILGTQQVDTRFSHLAEASVPTADAPSDFTPPATALTMNCAFGGNNTSVFLERAV